MSSTTPLISVVVPVYGCKECLSSLCSRVSTSLAKISDNYEIIMVNDASPDNCWETIEHIAKCNPNVRGINLSRNFGQHHAITCGLDHAKGAWTVVMDCDLQDQPEEIPRLYAEALKGFDVVLACRQHRLDSALRRLCSVLFYRALSYLTGVPQDPSVANFGIYSRKSIEAVGKLRESLRYFPVMVRWVGFKISKVDVAHARRETGVTSYTLMKLMSLATNVMLAFSDRPLKLMMKFGVVISLVSMLFAIYIVFRIWIVGVVVTGWASLMVSFWFLAGIIIFGLGLIGLYVGKIFDQVKQRPIYLVSDKVNF